MRGPRQQLYVRELLQWQQPAGQRCCMTVQVVAGSRATWVFANLGMPQQGNAMQGGFLCIALNSTSVMPFVQ